LFQGTVGYDSLQVRKADVKEGGIADATQVHKDKMEEIFPKRHAFDRSSCLLMAPTLR